MDDSRIPKKIYNYEAEGRRSVGRPRSRWKDEDYPNGERNEPMVSSYLDVVVGRINVVLNDEPRRSK
jgi:hypothetical protein